MKSGYRKESANLFKKDGETHKRKNVIFEDCVFTIVKVGNEKNGNI